MTEGGMCCEGWEMGDARKACFVEGGVIKGRGGRLLSDAGYVGDGFCTFVADDPGVKGGAEVWKPLTLRSESAVRLRFLWFGPQGRPRRRHRSHLSPAPQSRSDGVHLRESVRVFRFS